VYHRIKEYDWDTEATIGISPHSFSESQADVTTPQSGGMIPGIGGLQIGKVKKIDEDPQGETRILCDVPVITASGDGVWARQTTYYATKEAGNFFIPEVGDEVILGFLNEDPRYPVIIGSVYSKSQMPPYTPDAENTYKAIVTNSKMKIEFEDIKRIITIWTPNENYIEISDDQGTITIEDENKNKVVMSSSGIDFYTPKDFIVKADGNINMEAQMAISIKATQALTAEGLSVETKASTSNTMKGTTCEVNGSAQTTVKGGVVMIN
ncbi:MAG: phage baseplate assembly protein V, partial [Bacteroidota bacterium]